MSPVEVEKVSALHEPEMDLDDFFDESAESIEKWIRDNPESCFALMEDEALNMAFSKVESLMDSSNVLLDPNWMAESIVKLIDFDAIREEQEDERYIRKNGEMAYYGMSYHDFL